MTGRGLDILVTCGTGTAPTELAAFDAALQEAGVAHLNLIRLSSLIPPGSRVSAPQAWSAMAGGWGDRLYAVYAEHRVSTPGTRACAGLGWIQDQDTGDGVLVEHCGEDEASVEVGLKATVDDLVGRRTGRFGPPTARITSTVCSDEPVAAVVVAALRVEPW